MSIYLSPQEETTLVYTQVPMSGYNICLQYIVISEVDIIFILSISCPPPGASACMYVSCNETACICFFR